MASLTCEVEIRNPIWRVRITRIALYLLRWVPIRPEIKMRLAARGVAWILRGLRRKLR